MKKSCFLISYRKYHNPTGNYLESDVFERAKNDGFDAIEPLYNPGQLTVDVAKKVREKVLNLGLDVSCLSYAISFLHTSKEDAVRSLKDAVDSAKALGSPFIHHTFEGGLNNDLEIYQKAHKHFVEVIREVAYYAGEQGIDCIYEDQGYYVNTPERIANLLADVDLPNTGVCLDVGNSLFYDIPAERWAGIFSKYIKHVHIKDYIRKPAETAPIKGWHRTIEGNYLRGTVVGHGVVDFEKIFTILLANGYDGYFSLEYEGREDVLESVKESLANTEFFYNKAKANVEYLNLK